MSAQTVFTYIGRTAASIAASSAVSFFGTMAVGAITNKWKASDDTEHFMSNNLVPVAATAAAFIAYACWNITRDRAAKLSASFVLGPIASVGLGLLAVATGVPQHLTGDSVFKAVSAGTGATVGAGLSWGAGNLFGKVPPPPAPAPAPAGDGYQPLVGVVVDANVQEAPANVL